MCEWALHMLCENREVLLIELALVRSGGVVLRVGAFVLLAVHVLTARFGQFETALLVARFLRFIHGF